MARNFNGTSNTIAIATPSKVRATTPFSYSCWHQYALTATGNRTIFSCDFTSGGKSTWIRVGDAVANTPEFGYWDGTSNHRAVGGNTLTVGTWYSLVGTYDGATYTLYVNGTATTTADTTSPSFTPVTCQIGAENGGSFLRWIPGNIADVAVWNVALTALEAKALAAGIRPIFIRTASLSQWWPLDGLQSPEPNLVPSAGGNGTVNGATLGFGPPFAPFTPRWPMGAILPAPAPPPATGLPHNLKFHVTVGQLRSF